MPVVHQVYLHEDMYVALVVYQVVLKGGQFYTKTQARADIGAGRVKVDGIVIKRPQEIPLSGLHSYDIGPNTYSVQVNYSAKE